jgi:phosphomannomutase / phosphoglucomutase
VVDAGNGAGGPLAIRAMKALGLEPEALYCEMDGHFPNHHPDPTMPKSVAELTARVTKSGARVGIAYDGDADRLGAIDANGDIVWGDRLMIVFSRAILKERPGASILGEVKCSQTLYDDIAAHGGQPIMWKTGHSLIKTKMKESGALLAGEMSGHLFFADRYLATTTRSTPRSASSRSSPATRARSARCSSMCRPRSRRRSCAKTAPTRSRSAS